VAVSGSHGLRQGVTLRVHDDGPVGLDGVRIKFDDERVVSDAGLMLAATLVERLGIEELARSTPRSRASSKWSSSSQSSRSASSASIPGEQSA